MTTRDIILRAEQYANKENAAFYSYAEKVAMLQESWNTLYQYLCNTGDKYWVKRVNFSGKVVTLPNDCYQISAVYINQGSRKRQFYGYELRNNKIYIKPENYVLGSSFILEYYPTPIELQYKDDIKKSPFQNYGLSDVNDGKALHKVSGSTTYSIYDTVTKQEIETSLTTGVIAHIYKDGNILVKNSDSSFSVLNMGSGTITNIGTTVIIYNNSVFRYAAHKVYDINGNEVADDIILNVGTTYITDDFITFTETEDMPINGRTSIKVSTSTGITDDTKVYTKYKICGYIDNAFLTHDAISGTYYIESLYNDTVINYPNNIFFTMLALDIALKMRSKQGIENDQLEQQWSEARAALFNSIEKNKGNHVTIKDVYNDDSIGGIYY